MPFWLLRVSNEKSGNSLKGLLLYMTWSFSNAVFNILSLFWTISVLIIICHRELLSWCCLFEVLYASFTLVGISFFGWENISSTVLLKIFSVSTWVTSLSSIPIIHRFGGFIVSQTLWCFVPVFFDWLLISSTLASRPEFYLSCLFIVHEILFGILSFSFPVLFQFGFPLSDSISLLTSTFVSWIVFISFNTLWFYGLH